MTQQPQPPQQNKTPGCLKWLLGCGITAILVLVIGGFFAWHYAKKAMDKNPEFKLAMAIGTGNTKSVNAILDAHPELVKNGGPSLLPVALQQGRTEVAEALLAHGIDVNAVDSRGQTPLHMAAATGNVETITFLVKHGAKVDVADKSGNTPLHKAAEAGNQPVVEYLLSQGAEINTRNNNQKTPLGMPIDGEKMWNEMPAGAKKIVELSEKYGKTGKQSKPHIPTAAACKATAKYLRSKGGIE